MLTRLKISGFKNLDNVDIQFGPSTCIAGSNGVGKSNLFDAIQFLSLLANHSISEAAAFIRDASGRSGSVRNIFRCNAGGYGNRIEFEAEMIVPESALDDLNQTAHATTTFLRYTLHLVWVDNPTDSLGPIRIDREQLFHIPVSEAGRHLQFSHKKTVWRDKVLKHGRRTVPYISTESDESGKAIINRHQDGGSKGRPQPIHAGTLPRTVVSKANADEAPTALCARREMESWRLLQLEPSSLRQSDTFTAPATLTPNGGHLPATLYRLAESGRSEVEKAGSLQRIANRLRELVPDVRRIRVEKDERLERFTVFVTLNDGTEHAARSLSDGTLRFLALVVLENDPLFKGVVCFEEPENGIHPDRIGSIVRLLQDIAADATEPPGEDNPLRQVILNTHSPTVVRSVPHDSLVIARSVTRHSEGFRENLVQFGHLSETWRAKSENGRGNVISPSDVGPYLNPTLPRQQFETQYTLVNDRKDLQLTLPLSSADA